MTSRVRRGGIGRETVTLEAASPYRFGIRVFGTSGTVIDNTVGIPAEHGGAFVEHCGSRVDVSYLPRIGKSKVTGTVRGCLRTVQDMSQVLAQ